MHCYISVGWNWYLIHLGEALCILWIQAKLQLAESCVLHFYFLGWNVDGFQQLEKRNGGLTLGRIITFPETDKIQVIPS